MGFIIVTDSTANLPDELIERHEIEILPLSFYVGGREYKSYQKGVKSDLNPFYTLLREKEHVTTSGTALWECLELFDGLLKAGKDLLYIGFSSGLSSSYQVGATALESLRAKYPERKVMEVDSRAAALGQGLLVLCAARLREQGAGMEEVAAWTLENRDRLCHWFTVDDLFFLQRGGRVSHTEAVVGSVLGVKPILHVDNEGKLVAVDKVRGRRASLLELAGRMEELALDPGSQTVCISHGDCLEDAEFVAAEVQKRFAPKEILMNYLEPVIGTHAGPGTVALFFLGREK